MGEYGIYYKENINMVAFEFANLIVNKGGNEPVFLCLGNSNVVGDLFGPMCGEILSKNFKIKNVYGNLSNNITSKNLKQTFLEIKQKHPFNPLVVIDSALSEIYEVGNVKFLPYGCLPAHENNNTIMGDCCFLGNVNVVGINGLMFLKTVKFEMVQKMCNFVCLAIKKSFEYLKNYQNSSNNLAISFGY